MSQHSSINLKQLARQKAKTITVSLEEIAKIYRNKIQKIHRVPRKILSNRGSQFISKFIEDLEKALGTKQTLSTVYYSQIDGQTERINQEVEAFL